MLPGVNKERLTSINKTNRFPNNKSKDRLTDINKISRFIRFTGRTDLWTSIGQTGLVVLTGQFKGLFELTVYVSLLEITGHIDLWTLTGYTGLQELTRCKRFFVVVFNWDSLHARLNSH